MTRFLGALSGVLLAGLVLLGCGSGKGATGVAQYYGNYHASGWIQDHAGQAVAGVAACTKCHEISILKVGSGIPNCMTTGCHHQSTPGWAGADVHGAKAKLAVVASGGSLVSCQICHGNNFSGGASTFACVTCHGVQAPHPAKPWRTSGGTSYTHTTTDVSNAVVCAQCHFPGSPSNPAGHPATPAPAGTQPGCYNATLCHGAAGSAPHALGAIWKDPTSAAYHGIEAKKDLKYCQSCHGTPGTTKFDGGSASTACSSCHSKTTGAGAHSTTWYLPSTATFPGYVASHRNATNPLSATGSCVICHAVTKTGTSALTSAPSCYSASSSNSEHAAVACHANGPGVAPHPVGATWTDPTNAGTTDASFHGIQAKADLLACQVCHGVPGTNKFDGGSTTTTCSSCHTQAKAHSNTWSKAPSSFSSGTYVASHRNTPAANDLAQRAAVCGLCHAVTVANGTPPMVGAPGCFSASYNTVNCHVNGPGAAAHPAPFLSGMTTTSGTGNTHQNVTAGQFAGECINCHDESGPGTAKVGPSCTVCHVSASPLASGKGPGTCQSCHPDATFKTLGPATAGAAFPNVPGAHGKHMGLLTALTCATCHAGSQPGEGGASQPHYTGANRGPNGTPTGIGPAPVAINALFKAKTGTLGTTPSLSAFTCNAVSCHGGQTTPGWQSGKVTVANQCSSCHASGTGQYNSYNSGQHGKHSGALCTDCHDVTTANGSGATNHFNTLNTSALEGPVTGTIVFSAAATGNRTYTNNQCTLTCHFGGNTKNHNPESWR